MRPAITVEKLGKQYRQFHPERPSTLVEAVAHGWRRLRPTDRFWALRDVEFAVQPGEMLGVIGHNGAGKSTLLRLLGHVGRPDEGRVQTRGRIGALLDLGTGFHPELTGRENIMVAGVIAGLTRREVNDRFDDIVEFAELEAFIDSPLRTYSSGMQMRLAFAVASHIEPEVLLIDEVLAVGDMAFQQKCLRRIEQFKANGCTVVLVSHDHTLVQQLCSRALWLRNGEMVALGEAEVVVGQYAADMSSETARRTPAAQAPTAALGGEALRVNDNRFGSQEMTIGGVTLRDADGGPVDSIEPGGGLRVDIHYDAPIKVPTPVFSATLSTADGTICYDTSTAGAGVETPDLSGQGVATLAIERLDLQPGDYYVDVGVYPPDWRYAYDYHWHVYQLSIRGRSDKGVLRPPQRWTISPSGRQSVDAVDLD